jgi:hypothetical protein
MAYSASSLLWVLVTEGIEIHGIMRRLATSPQNIYFGLTEQEERGGVSR